METIEEQIQRLIREDVALASYDPNWPAAFAAEAWQLRSIIPEGLIGRIEHIGSTAVPGMVAKPIVDMLVEVLSLDVTREKVAPLLRERGYEYVWRPTSGADVGPWYAWFIKRNREGVRTHHIHMVEPHFPHWERLAFRDYLRENPSVAREYEALKSELAARFPNDRVGYTEGKTAFITRVTAIAGENPKSECRNPKQ